MGIPYTIFSDTFIYIFSMACILFILFIVFHSCSIFFYGANMDSSHSVQCSTVVPFFSHMIGFPHVFKCFPNFFPMDFPYFTRPLGGQFAMIHDLRSSAGRMSWCPWPTQGVAACGWPLGEVSVIAAVKTSVEIPHDWGSGFWWIMIIGELDPQLCWIMILMDYDTYDWYWLRPVWTILDDLMGKTQVFVLNTHVPSIKELLQLHPGVFGGYVFWFFEHIGCWYPKIWWQNHVDVGQNLV